MTEPMHPALTGPADVGESMKLAALAKLASEATPGPWDASWIRGLRDGYVRARGRTVCDVRYRHGITDAAYIAAASPDVVLALVRVALAAQAAATMNHAPMEAIGPVYRACPCRQHAELIAALADLDR